MKKREQTEKLRERFAETEDEARAALRHAIDTDAAAEVYEALAETLLQEDPALD